MEIASTLLLCSSSGIRASTRQWAWTATITSGHVSDRQLRCVLYWQGGARAELKRQIAAALRTLPGCRAETCPEAMGVNVTATLAAEGITLEWLPVRIARQVALIAYPNAN